jgi:GMP synthase (glutamine-hydrolysing)
MAKGMSRDRVKIILFQFRDDDNVKKLDRDSFTRAMRLAPEQVVTFDVLAGTPDASMLEGADAIVVGGSKLSVWEDVPNLGALIAVLRAAREKKIPILGVCFGAQLLAHAFGGKVIRDDEHEEWGTYEMSTTDDSLGDMLFADAPFSFPAMCAHHDRIVIPPAGAVVLASSQGCPVQAFSVPGADVYGVQFHPERSKADYERLVDLRAKDLPPSAQAGLDRIRATLKDTPEAESILAKFIDRIVLRK